jgi:UPF0755 protein
MLKKMSIVLLILFISLCAGFFIVQNKVESYLSVPRIDNTVLFTVKVGSNFSRLGNRFIEQSLINEPIWWKLLGKFHPELTKIKSGTYTPLLWWQLAF